MNRRLHTAVSALLFSAILLGCEDAGKKPVQARVPALKAAPAAPPQAPVELALLPVVNPPHRSYVRLLPAVPAGKDYLIQKVKEKFASGEQNFKAGHMEAARKDFDDAVDWMLESGYDPDGDPALSSLFHHVVDTVYGYELQAFRKGEGFSEAPAVPAPIDEVAEVTTPADPRLKERAEEAAKSLSHDLPLTVNDQVLSFLNFFQTPRGRAIVETGLRRSGRYREMISRVLREEGLPQDLIYLAQAESAFQPLALSRAGARGIWQFVAYRGQQYGLHHTWWVDERQDAETLRALNPSLLRMATPDDPSFELRLPQGMGEKFTAEIAAVPPGKWTSWRRHRVEPGETLASIAKKFRVTAAAIVEANNLERNSALDPGAKLTIPATQPISETKRRLVSYRVRRGDTP